jgi:hypothetical protein
MLAERASLVDIDPSIALAIGVRDAVRLPLVTVDARERLPGAGHLVVAAGHLLRRGALFGPGDRVDARDAGVPAAGTRLAVVDGPRLDDARLAERAARQASRRDAMRAAVAGAQPRDALLAVLWWVAERWGRPVARGIALELALDRDVLAALTALEPEPLERLVRVLELEGSVECAAGAWWVIRDEGRTRRDALRLRVIRQHAAARASQRDFLAAYGALERIRGR